MYNFLLISFTVLSSSPGLTGTEREAFNMARKALLATAPVKKSLKVIEKKGKDSLYRYTGMDEKDLIYFSWALPVASGKISTKPFKKLGFHGKDWFIRPEIEYKFRGDNEFRGDVNIFFEF